MGGVAAVLQRVPVNTQDFDLVHDRAHDNVERLLAALAELGAVYRDDPRNLRPNESHLLGAGNQLLRAGNLKFDVLGAIDWGADTTNSCRARRFSTSAATRFEFSSSRSSLKSSGNFLGPRTS